MIFEELCDHIIGGSDAMGGRKIIDNSAVIGIVFVWRVLIVACFTLFGIGIVCFSKLLTLFLELCGIANKSSIVFIFICSFS